MSGCGSAARTMEQADQTGQEQNEGDEPDDPQLGQDKQVDVVNRSDGLDIDLKPGLLISFTP